MRNRQNLKCFPELTELYTYLLRGLARTLFGALNACLIAAAVYGFVMIKQEGGYTAVFEFIGACALVMIALANAYLLGCKKRGAKR